MYWHAYNDSNDFSDEKKIKIPMETKNKSKAILISDKTNEALFWWTFVFTSCIYA